jgi:DNA-binding response OmpR family regulator
MYAPHLPTVAVVDGNVNRYPFLTKLAQQKRTLVLYFSDGRSALRSSRAWSPSFWLVNHALDDMSGIDCIEMLVELTPETRFYLIADAYSADEERLCFRFANVKYLCRPLDELWLSRLLPATVEFTGPQRSAATSSVNGQAKPFPSPRRSVGDASRAPPGPLNH